MSVYEQIKDDLFGTKTIRHNLALDFLLDYVKATPDAQWRGKNGARGPSAR